MTNDTIVIKKIRKILVANRGEIAVRIMRTCRKMGIFTAAVFSDADAGERFVREADEAIRIGGFQPSESYLDQEKIITAARLCGADAIHPGYGFLSENASFAARCKKENIIFIGPNSAAIEAMGSKIRAKEIMAKAGVPVIPGYNGAKQDAETLIAESKKIGFPVLLKASAGGGGKGMRVVRAAGDLDKSIAAAKREAKNAFGDDDLLIEKYFDSSRHIEIQIFGDSHKNYIHLGERECSIQRRHQKIIEESPSPAITPATRKAMGDAAVKAAAAINYDNAGTVEFIYTGSGEFYFLEVNTRLQVEHPVTEMVTGLDLVEMQIRIASGEAIALNQDDIRFDGHALECRLYAEDPSNDFLPATGKLLHWNKPPVAGLRYDSGVSSGSTVGVFYDPMIAKIISHGSSRGEAISRMIYALSHLEISGLVNNRDFLLQVIRHEDFIAGKFDTHFLQSSFSFDPDPYAANKALFACAALAYDHSARMASRSTLQELPPGWRNNYFQAQEATYTDASDPEKRFEISYRCAGKNIEASIGGSDYALSSISIHGGELRLEINGVHRKFHIDTDNEKIYLHCSPLGSAVLKKQARFTMAEQAHEPGGYNAPMPGQVIDILVSTGQKVRKGDTLIILLSMKMENAIEAMEDGEVEEIYVSKDAFVEAESPLIRIKV